MLVKIKKKSTFYKVKKYRKILPFLLPAMILAFVFSYIPMLGLIVAFKDRLNLTAFTPFEAFANANWTLDNFTRLFGSTEFLQAVRNTLVISFLKIVILFPLPIFFAILITEVKNKFSNKTVQAILYLPHFLSWPIVIGIFMNVFDPSSGAVNNILIRMGLMNYQQPTFWFADRGWFHFMMLLTAGYKDIGWSCIIYIAAIMAIDTEMFEAARIDGANKFQQVRYITIPSIVSTIALLLIIRIGFLMDAGFEQIFAMINPEVRSVAEIIGTYVYRLSFDSVRPDFTFATAVGLFNGIIALILILFGNWTAKRIGGKGIW
ncbi:MAG: ABC transporter permease subunit [Firmicutes bacterium]|nr:ABC transporter permease subunit [Bacillota bacterium]